MNDILGFFLPFVLGLATCFFALCALAMIFGESDRQRMEINTLNKLECYLDLKIDQIKKNMA